MAAPKNGYFVNGAIMTTIALVLGIVGKLALDPVSIALARHDAELSLIRKEFATISDVAEGRRRIELDISRIEAGHRLLRDSQVSRGEHQRDWLARDAAVANLQRQVDEAKKQINDVFPVNKVMEDLMRRIGNLESPKPK